jgi:hypothetical protein
VRIIRRDNGRSHWYIDADTDQKVDGVTTIVGNGLPKPALLNWAGDATAEYAIDRWEELSALPTSERLKKMKGGRYEKRDAAANKGTQIHKLAERLIAGERVTVPDALTGYVESCVNFINDFDVRPVHVEAVVYSETRRHVGTLDLIADVLIPEIPDYDHIERDGEGYARGLLDWKTSRSGIFGDVAMQLSPYRFSEFLILPDGEVIDMPPVDFCAGIHIRPDGYTLVPLLCGEQQYRDFLYLNETARIVAGLRDLVGQPIEPPTASRYVLAKADGSEDGR